MVIAQGDRRYIAYMYMYISVSALCVSPICISPLLTRHMLYINSVCVSERLCYVVINAD